MPSYLLDASGARHELGPTRYRLISLVPSTTETVFALGMGERLLGVTRYCVEPPQARYRCRVVGGTKAPRIDDILELSPDLVLANLEENRKEDVERLRRSVPVFVAYPRDVTTALGDIEDLARLLGCRERGERLVGEIERQRRTLDPSARFRYLYLIWKEPYMVAGKDTFIDALLGEAGGVNLAPDGGRYPVLTEEALVSSSADALLLASEPFPFDASHREALRGVVGPKTTVHLVDGQRLSWHGARLRSAFPYLRTLVGDLAGC